MDKLRKLTTGSPKMMEFIRFALVGGFAFVIQFLIYTLCIYIYHKSLGVLEEVPSVLTVCVIVSYLISMVFNFIMTTYFTFNVEPDMKKGIGFLFSHIINMGLQVLLVHLFTNFGVMEKYAIIPAMCICVPVNFLLVRFFVKR